MNKSEFIAYIATQNDCTKKKAEEIINVFTNSVINILGKGETISLIGFGNFTVSKVAARTGHNPKTGDPLEIKAYNQPKFKAGDSFKKLCNK